MPIPSNHVEFTEVVCKKASKSGEAVLCTIDGVDRWVPKSLIHDDSEAYKPGTDGVLYLPEWFATKEGLV